MNPNSVQTDGEIVTLKDGTKTMVEFVSLGSAGLIRLPSLGTLVFSLVIIFIKVVGICIG